MPIWFKRIVDHNGQSDPKKLRKDGAIVQIQIGVAGPLVEWLSERDAPIPPSVVGAAMLDTGASRTCVDVGILKGLGLEPTGIVDAWSPAGNSVDGLYFANLNFPELSVYGEFAKPDIGLSPLITVSFDHAVVGIDLGGQTVHGLPLVAFVGRDILRVGQFLYDGLGGFYSVSY